MTKLIYLFAEDYGHEQFLTSLLRRHERQFNVEIDVCPRNVTGGHGKMLTELKEFIRDLEGGWGAVPDLLIVVRDANCEGIEKRKREIVGKLGSFRNLSVCAVPDPHIERWLLLDSAAFKTVFKKGCSAPDQKCDRKRYKRLLIEAIRDAGFPLSGSPFDFTRDLIDAMDLDQIERTDKSLGKLLKDLREVFKQWSQSNP